MSVSGQSLPASEHKPLILWFWKSAILLPLWGLYLLGIGQVLAANRCNGYCPPISGTPTKTPPDRLCSRRDHAHCAGHDGAGAAEARRTDRRAVHGLDRYRQAGLRAAAGARSGNAGSRGDSVDSGDHGRQSRQDSRASRNSGEA